MMIKKRMIILLMALLAPIQEIKGSEGNDIVCYNEGYTPVALSAVVANPERYHNECITVVGVLSFKYGNDKNHVSLFYTMEHEQYGVYKEAVFFVLSKEEQAYFKELEGGYVIISGFFSSSNRGPWSANSGSLSDISRIEKHESYK